LVAPVLRHFAEHPGARLSDDAIGSLAGMTARDGHRLGEWLERIGLLDRIHADGTGAGTAYALTDPNEQRQRRSRPLVLLVEDEASVAGMTEAVLTSEGYSVVLVRNPLEAHVILRVIAFDAILADSFSPTLELAVRVLGPLLRRSAGTPVVLFTAHHWNPARVQAEGFTEIVTKPFQVDAFLARMEQLTSSHRAAGA
jgi:CheY-like chemotaxis protein